ncbi:MAG: glycoside hydrolase family 28 protein [Bryobacteraceae bacterium]
MRGGSISVALLILLPSVAGASDSAFNVRDFGATGDGRSNDAAAIQKAIDACAKAGGGVVLLPAGDFLSGTIVLRSNITLRISPGATLWGSKRMEDYSPHHLIYAKDVGNVAIDGGGRINGNGDSFWRERSDHPYLLGLRPRPSPAIEIVDSRGVRIQDISLRNTPGWGIHPLRCDGVTIRGVSIVSHLRGPNTDGIDVDGSRNVRIADCYIEGGDDAIVIKTVARPGQPLRPSENITVTNCVMTSTSNCFKIGTEGTAGFKNIAITNCVMFRLPHAFRAPISGIAIESVDGGTLDGLVASNLTMRDVGTPIFVRLGNRGRGMTEPRPGILQNVSISNVVATGSLVTSSITGLPGHMVRRVSLENINISMKGGHGKMESLEVPELPEKYPEAWMFGSLPAYGFYARHVEGLTLRNVQVRWEEADARPGMVFDDVKDLFLDAFQTDTVSGGAPLIRLHNTNGAFVRGARIPSGARLLVEVTGVESREIKVTEGLLRGAQSVAAGGEVPTGAIVP